MINRDLGEHRGMSKSVWCGHVVTVELTRRSVGMTFGVDLHGVDHEIPDASLERDVGSVGRLLHFRGNTAEE